MLVLEDPLKRTEILMDKLKLFGALAGFKKVKYLDVIRSNMIACYFKIVMLRHGMKLNDTLRCGKLKLLLEKNSMITMNVLLKMMFSFQTVPVLITHAPFKQCQKDMSKFVHGEKK